MNSRHSARCSALVLIGILAAGTGAWGLDAEVNLKVTRTAAAVAVGPPGSAAQEVVVDRSVAQAAVSHLQPLFGGLSLEGTAWLAIDTLPSETPRNLPSQKLALSSRVLEAWLGWEPLPGALSLGVGKRVIHPSSGFSHTPLDFLDRGGETAGAQAAARWEEGWWGAQAATFGDLWSASVFVAPALVWGNDTAEAGWKWVTAPQPQEFAQGRLGLSLGTADLTAVVLRKGTENRMGLGLQASAAESLTLRAEAASSTDPGALALDSLAGLTWTNPDQSTVMAEVWADGTQGALRKTGFVRVAGKVDTALEGEAWTQVDLSDGSGLMGTGLTWTSPKVALLGSWLGSWGEAASRFGASPLRWRVTAEARTYY